eukprot:TRINITY_DN69720_c0_g1_i1.p1 TRINITY_DN69720_c0_g1~~TRINITY_DN69720_c0_g1_i1.p1  ORF type:complete len:113 (-),score=39.34 TRINITY_DN69720_c0_g1_i1:28-366(-)
MQRLLSMEFLVYCFRDQMTKLLLWRLLSLHQLWPCFREWQSQAPAKEMRMLQRLVLRLQEQLVEPAPADAAASGDELAGAADRATDAGAADDAVSGALLPGVDDSGRTVRAA